MCQAYEGEKRAIQKEECHATVRGFTAARRGKPKKSNPYHKQWMRYEYEAWNHGWGCWHEKIMPFAIELLFFGESAWIGAGSKIRERFKKDRKLPKRLVKILD